MDLSTGTCTMKGEDIWRWGTLGRLKGLWRTQMAGIGSARVVASGRGTSCTGVMAGTFANNIRFYTSSKTHMDRFMVSALRVKY